MQDPRFIQFIQKVINERLSSFHLEDLLALDLVHREKRIPSKLKDRCRYLVNQGVIEALGRGKGTRYILSHQFYKFIGQRGVHTRRQGLDRDTNKELLLKHIKKNEKEGSKLKELKQVLPMLSQYQLQGLLKELKVENLIHCVGRTKAGRWYPGPLASGKTVHQKK